MPSKADPGKEPSRKAGRRKPVGTPPEPVFRPFADDATVRTLGELSFENGTARIAIHGALDVTRDRAGLDRARALKATFEAIVAALEAEDLPEAVAEETRAPKSVKNPFA